MAEADSPGPEARGRGLIAALAAMAPGERARLLKRLPPPAFRGIAEEWSWKRHEGQQEPEGDWRVWLMMAGRGFGKTRAGAEWVWARMRACPGARVALVGANLGEVEKVMVRGASGILAAARTGEEARWAAGERVVRFGCGGAAFAYSAARPESLRGPQHHFAWCDELGKWPAEAGGAAWDNLMLGLRLGAAPRTLVTTTPRAGALLRRIRRIERCVETRGRTTGNPHLPADFVAAVQAAYGGRRIGRQELDGELIEDVEGSLWTRDAIEAARGSPPPLEALARVVVGVDPPTSAGGTCGISVCGQAADGILWVLADASAGGLSPEGWARKVARTVEQWQADRVAAEANQGGDMVASVLRGAAPGLPLRLVHASRGKSVRAEPVAAMFERGAAKFGGAFPALEDELAGMTAAGGYEGPGSSPDRADAMVWAMTELDGPQRAEPRVLGFFG